MKNILVTMILTRNTLAAKARKKSSFHATQSFITILYTKRYNMNKIVKKMLIFYAQDVSMLQL